MGTEEQKLQRLESKFKVMEQLIKDSYKLLLKSLNEPTEEEQTKDERIKNLRDFNEAYRFRIKEQEAEIENLKDELEALNVAFKVLLKKDDNLPDKGQLMELKEDFGHIQKGRVLAFCNYREYDKKYVLEDLTRPIHFAIPKNLLTLVK